MTNDQNVIATNEIMAAALATTDLVRLDEEALAACAAYLIRTAAPDVETLPVVRLAKASQQGLVTATGEIKGMPEDEEAVFRAVLLLNAVNYRFWSDGDDQPWAYHGQRGFAGLLALVCDCTAADSREGLSDRFLVALDDRACMQGLARMDDRRRHAAEVATFIDQMLEPYPGDGCALLYLKERDEHEADRFVARLVKECPGYRDVVRLGGHEIPMHKRAWLAVLMLDAASGHPAFRYDEDLAPGINNFFSFHGAESGLAIDYRLPQALREAGVLVYRSDLAEQVDAQQMLTNSEAEAAIRVASALAFRRLLEVTGLRAAELDRRLWLMAGNASRPHHRFETTAY